MKHFKILQFQVDSIAQSIFLQRTLANYIVSRNEKDRINHFFKTKIRYLCGFEKTNNDHFRAQDLSFRA